MKNNEFSYKITLSYDGSRFFGSAKQNNFTCVQNTLDELLKSVGIFNPSIFASRTDKGVHALRAVAKIKSPYELNTQFVKNKINSSYTGIYIKDIKKYDFEPRFDAKIRSYRYIITKNINAFNQAYLCEYKKDINIKLMQEAASCFVGLKDFKNFALSKEDKKESNTIREIYKIRVYRYKDLVIFNFFANGFLRGQIRLMMEFLLKINDGKLNIKQLEEQINTSTIYSRTLASPNGLYLKSICY